MASFTQPEASPASVTPFISNRSQGFTASTEPLAALFKGVGQVAMQGVAIADEHQTMAIKGQADAGVAGIFNDAGFRTAGNSETGTPAELKDYASQLDNTKKAYMSGSLSQTALNIRVDALSRQMRMNYPGYGDDIDKLIGGALNRSTANDLWKGLAQEWQTEKTAAIHEQDKYDTMVKEWAGDGKLYRAFPNWDQMVAQGKQPDRDEVVAKVGQVAAGDAQRAADKSIIEYTKAKREENLTHTYDTAQSDVNDVSRTFMQAGTQSGDLIKKLSLTDPTKVSDSDLQAMSAQVEPLILQAKTQIEQKLLDKSYDSLTPTQKKEIEDRALTPILGIKEAITDRDVGFFNLNHSLTAVGSEKAIATLTNGGDASDVFRQYQLTKTLLGDLAAQAFLNKTSGKDPAHPDQTNSDFLAAKIATMGVVTDTKPLADQIANMNNVNPGKKSDPASVNKVITDTTNILLDPNTKPEGKAAVAKNLFSPDNAGFLGKFSAAVGPSGVSDRMVVFNRLTSPAMSASVAEIAKTNPNIAKDYQNTLFEGFKELFGNKIENEVSANQYSSIIGFKFNPKTFQIESNNKNSSVVGISDANNPRDLLSLWNRSSQKSDMNDVNKFLVNFKQAMTATGQDPNVAVEELFKMTGVLDGGHPPTSMFSQIGTAVMSVLKPISDTMGLAGPGGMPGVATIKDAKTQALDDQMTALFGQGHKNGMEGDPHQELRDFIGKSEGADYNTLQGGIKIPLTSMSIDHAEAIAHASARSGQSTSTAMGKYQIIDSTLHRAMDALGIKGTDKFDAETQDRIANWIIDNEAGGGTDPKKLAGVWASLPQDVSGAGAYDGVNGNKAQAKFADLMSVIGRK